MESALPGTTQNFPHPGGESAQNGIYFAAAETPLVPNQIQLLMAHNQMMQLMTNQIGARSSQLQQVSKQLQSCQLQLKMAQDESKLKEDEIQSLKSENQRLSANTIRNERENAILRNENETLRGELSRLSELERQISKLKQIMESKAANEERLKSKNRDMNNRLKEGHQKIQMLSLNLAKASTEKEAIQKELRTLEKAHAKLRTLKDKLGNDLECSIAQEMKSKEMELLNSELEELRQVHEQTFHRVDRAEAEAKKWKKQHEIIRSELMQAKASHSRLMNGLFAERRTLESRINTLHSNNDLCWYE